MNKESVIIPVLVFFLTLAFLFVSLFVWLRKDNPVFVSRKIKLGAAIITLTSILAACNGSPSADQETCYKQASTDTLEPSQSNDTTKISDTLNKKSTKDPDKKKFLKLTKQDLLKDSIIVQPPVQDATCYAAVNMDDSL